MSRLTPRKRPGFTLIELLVVVIIIGILAGVGVKGYAQAMDRARNSGVVSNCRSILIGVENWKTDHSGLPVDLIGSTAAQYVAADSTADFSSNFPVAYCPGGFLPKGPWSKVPQTVLASNANNAAALADPAINTAFTQDAQGNFGQLNIASNGTFNDNILGAATTGTINANGTGAPSVRTDYGYVYYAGDVNSGRYMILGVGKVQSGPISSAEIVGLKSNFN